MSMFKGFVYKSPLESSGRKYYAIMMDDIEIVYMYDFRTCSSSTLLFDIEGNVIGHDKWYLHSVKGYS